MKARQNLPKRSLQMKDELLDILTRHVEENVFIQDKDLRYQLIINPQLGLKEEEIIGKTD